MAATSQRKVEEERGRALVPFVGQYVSLVTRGVAGTDDADARPGQLFIGLLAKFDATTIVLAGVVQIDTRTRRIRPFAADGGDTAASPVFLTAQFKQLARVARCASGTLHKLFRDPNRPCIPMAPSEAEERAARRYLQRVFIRRYVFTELRERIRPPENADGDGEGGGQTVTTVGTAPSANGGGGGGGDGAAPAAAGSGVDESLETAVSEAVGGAAPTSTDAVSRIRMPLAAFVAGTVQKTYRAQREAPSTEEGGVDPNGDGDAVAGLLGPPVAQDGSHFAAILRGVPQELGTMRVCDARQLVSEECLELRRLYAPRKISPATRLNEVVHSFVKACFLFTIVLSVLYCVLGGIMIGAAVSGPLTSGGIAADFAGYMWYLLIVPGVISACHGVSLSARGEAAASPVSRVPRFWLIMEIVVVVLLAPSFVFSAMFLNNESTPRRDHKTARAYWESLAVVSDERICSFQETERCSGYSEPCYIPGNETTVYIIQRADCAIQCRMSLGFLRDLPSQTCGAIFSGPVRNVSVSTVAFLVVFVCLAAVRLVGLALIRRYFSRRAIQIHTEMLQRFADDRDQQQQQLQQQQQQQAQPAADDHVEAATNEDDGAGEQQ